MVQVVLAAVEPVTVPLLSLAFADMAEPAPVQPALIVGTGPTGRK
jgi:hypothetical protein